MEPNTSNLNIDRLSASLSPASIVRVDQSRFLSRVDSDLSKSKHGKIITFLAKLFSDTSFTFSLLFQFLKNVTQGYAQIIKTSI